MTHQPLSFLYFFFNLNSVKEQKICVRCGELIPPGRFKNSFCSKKCEAEIEGYSDVWMRKLRSQLEGTTAWRPLPMDPVQEIISARPVTVFSDIHAPIHSVKWMELGIKTAKLYKSDTLIINGDFIDANTISRHLGGYYRRKNELEDDLAAGEALMKIFAKEFKRVYCLSGNHCLQRLIKVFSGEVKAQRLWNLFGAYENVKLTSRSFLIVNKDVIVGHPRSYSRIRGSMTQRIAQIKQKHNHEMIH